LEEKAFEMLATSEVEFVWGERYNYPSHRKLILRRAPYCFYPKFDKVPTHSLHPGNFHQSQIITQNHCCALLKKPKLPNEIICAFGTKVPFEAINWITGKVTSVRDWWRGFLGNHSCVFGVLEELSITFKGRMLRSESDRDTRGA
jgi:hypothetical protein